MIELLRCKLCRVKVTAIDPQADGAMEMDETLMRVATLRPFQRLTVLNRETGLRFETFALPVKDAGALRLNGGDARLAEPGDLIDIEIFQILDEGKFDAPYVPLRVIVDEENRLVRESPRDGVGKASAVPGASK
jgi:aspartate 1-decarboxylase